MRLSVVFFFFKQKTAYEMVYSDWSSDVCSSDLDPAQPYGAALPWPKLAGGRAARVAGAHVVLLGGEAALFVERGGRSIVSLREPDEEWLRPAIEALVRHVKTKRGKRLAVERFDGEPVADTELMPLLLEVGFLAGPRRAVL